MATYVDLGASQRIPAGADSLTGLNQNQGNLTTIVDSGALGGVKQNQFEIWHMVLTNVPLGGQARIVYNGRSDFGFVFPFTGSEWWGRLPMRQNDTLYFLWNSLVTVAQIPQLTCYTWYDADLMANQ
jgi:hypothetical protein